MWDIKSHVSCILER